MGRVNGSIKGSVMQAKIAQKNPYYEYVEQGKKYMWCACGLSNRQPFCDGSHSGTGFSPVLYEAKATEKIAFCGCKQSKKFPLCDGSHSGL